MMGFISDINPFKYNNPADDAQPYLDQIPDTMKQYYNPYIQSGQQSSQIGQNEAQGLLGNRQSIQDALNQLMSNPQDLYKNLTSNYKTSPGYEFERNEALRGAGNAAAAGGFAGTPQHQRYAGEISQGLASRDFNNYLSNILGMYTQGLSGKQGLYNQGLGLNEANTQRGFSASTGLADNLAQALMSQANLAYAGAANENQNKQGLWGNILGAGATIASNMMKPQIPGLT